MVTKLGDFRQIQINYVLGSGGGRENLSDPAKEVNYIDLFSENDLLIFRVSYLNDLIITN